MSAHGENDQLALLKRCTVAEADRGARTADPELWMKPPQLACFNLIEMNEIRKQLIRTWSAGIKNQSYILEHQEAIQANHKRWTVERCSVEVY